MENNHNLSCNMCDTKFVTEEKINKLIETRKVVEEKPFLNYKCEECEQPCAKYAKCKVCTKTLCIKCVKKNTARTSYGCEKCMK